MSEIKEKDIKCKVKNDYTVDDLESYNQSATSKKVSEEEINMCKILAEKYDLKDSNGNYNWVKVLKAIEFHNQAIATILNTFGWFLPIHTPMGTFDIRIDKILFTIKSLSHSSGTTKRYEKANEFINWYNNYYVYRQKAIRLKKNFQKYHYYRDCLDTTNTAIPPKVNQNVKAKATLASYVGSDCWHNKRKGKILEMTKTIPYLCTVKFDDSDVLEKYLINDLVIQAKIDKIKAKIEREVLRANNLKHARNEHINRVYDKQ